MKIIKLFESFSHKNYEYIGQFRSDMTAQYNEDVIRIKKYIKENGKLAFEFQDTDGALLDYLSNIINTIFDDWKITNSSIVNQYFDRYSKEYGVNVLKVKQINISLILNESKYIDFYIKKGSDGFIVVNLYYSFYIKSKWLWTYSSSSESLPWETYICDEAYDNNGFRELLIMIKSKKW